MTETPTIAMVLDDHYPLRKDDSDPDLIWWRCACGEAVDYSPNLDQQTAEECHRGHLAEMLSERTYATTKADMPEPPADRIAVLGTYGAAKEEISNLHRLHAKHLQDAAANIRAYKKDRDLIADAKQKADDQVKHLLGVLDAVDEMWGDPDEARRILRKALAKAGLR